LALRDPAECEEAVLEVTRENRTISQVLDRLSLRVQDRLDPVDDLVATRQEEFEKVDMGLERMQSHASISVRAPAATTRR
jgi:hypothetical protein